MAEDEADSHFWAELNTEGNSDFEVKPYELQVNLGR